MDGYFGFAAFICGGMLFLLVIVGVPLAFLAYRRRLKHQETMAMIEKGLLDVSHANGNGKDTLRWGIVITALGLALGIGLYPLGASLMGGYFPYNFGPWMLIGLIPLFFGLALIVIYLVTREKKSKDAE